jgi:hypothetical protein
MLTSMPRPALSMKVMPLRLRMTLVVLCRSHLMRSRSSDASSPPTMRPLTSTIVTSCSTRTVAVRSCLALDGAELFVRPPRSPQQPQRLTPRTPNRAFVGTPTRRSLPSQIAQRRRNPGALVLGTPIIGVPAEQQRIAGIRLSTTWLAWNKSRNQDCAIPAGLNLTSRDSSSVSFCRRLRLNS